MLLLLLTLLLLLSTITSIIITKRKIIRALSAALIRDYSRQCTGFEVCILSEILPEEGIPFLSAVEVILVIVSQIN